MSDRTMLQFDYEVVDGKVVTAVLGFSDVLLGWESIAIVTSEGALLIRVDQDTDELMVNLEPAPDEGKLWHPVPDLASAVGLKLGWCWVGRNYRGYLDMFTVSFSDLDPQVCFIGEASQIRIKQIVTASRHESAFAKNQFVVRTTQKLAINAAQSVLKSGRTR